MAYRHLRDFMRALEERGELRRVEAPVEPKLEIAAIVERLARRGGPAVLFERVIGAHLPVAANLFGTPRRLALALGAERIETLGDRLAQLLELARAGVPETLGDRVRLLGRLRELSGLGPRLVRAAPCQEVVHTANPSFEAFPALQNWPADAGPSIGLPLICGPDTLMAHRTPGSVRLYPLDRRTAALRLSPLPVDPALDPALIARHGGRVPVAVALGADPATTLTLLAPLPPAVPPLVLAGLLRGQAVPVVRGRTVEIEVPAEAEMVFEGWVEAAEFDGARRYGEHTGHDAPLTGCLRFHLTAVTHRRDPVWPAGIVGRPPLEEATLLLAAERLLLPLLRLAAPEIVDLHLPAAGALHNLVVVAARARYPGQARQALHALWGFWPFALSKIVVVVDAGADVRRPADVLWRLGANVDPGRDLVLAEGPLSRLDHATPTPGFGARLGIDATTKPHRRAASEPSWPAETAVSEEMRRLVERRWGEYGLP